MLALVSSRAGGGTVPDTVLKVKELMARLKADLVAPEDTLKEVVLYALRFQNRHGTVNRNHRLPGTLKTNIRI